MHGGCFEQALYLLPHRRLWALAWAYGVSEDFEERYRRYRAVGDRCSPPTSAEQTAPDGRNVDTAVRLDCKASIDMMAAVVHRPGKPEVLELREVLRPKSRSGWVLIKVMAFGLNRSELFTRQGHSGSAVTFPRILGIECVGVVEAAPDSPLEPGQKVAAVMGGMGRAYDGSYAEYTLVPEKYVMPVATALPWETLAAIPEAFLTAWGSLVTSLNVRKGNTLLIRSGTSSVGMAAATLAKSLGVTVVATTRSAAKKQALIPCCFRSSRTSPLSRSSSWRRASTSFGGGQERGVWTWPPHGALQRRVESSYLTNIR